jgi:hypothetical protein
VLSFKKPASSVQRNAELDSAGNVMLNLIQHPLINGGGFRIKSGMTGQVWNDIPPLGT